jgi:hypothetical protein
MRYSMAMAGAVLAVSFLAVPAQGQDAKPKVTSHDLAGRENCLMCHSGTLPNIPGVPASHAERPNEVCQWCHAPEAEMQTKTPKAITHTLEGRDNCLMCHKPGALEAVPDAPASHEGREVKWCSMCHVAKSG